jgi:hypothetical protein
LKRPQLQRLLLDLHRAEIDHIVVYKLDRLSRSVKDFHTLLERFEQSGATLPYDVFCALETIKMVRSHTRTSVDRVFLLKGLLICTHCGSGLTPFWVQKKNGLKIFYYRCIATSLYKTRCPLGQYSAEKIERLVEEQLGVLVNQQGFLEELIDGINLKTVEAVGPFLEERRGLDRRLRDTHWQIEHYVEILGQQGSAILPLIEAKIKHLQAEEIRIVKRRDELTLQLQGAPHLVNAQIMLDHLKDFTQLMAQASPEEKAQILQLILKEVRVSKELLTLNMYDFSSLAISNNGLKNRTEWLPGPDSNQRPSG